MSEWNGLNGGKASDWLRPMHQIGPCSTLWVEFDYQAPTEEAASSGFGSSLHTGGKSEAQLTKKQAVLLMHDTLPQGIKSVCALLQNQKH